jgi:hypothetical protein
MSHIAQIVKRSQCYSFNGSFHTRFGQGHLETFSKVDSVACSMVHAIPSTNEMLAVLVIFKAHPHFSCIIHSQA